MQCNAALAETHAQDLEGQSAFLFANVAGHEKIVQTLANSVVNFIYIPNQLEDAGLST